MAVVIIGREIAVSALREWMAEIGARGRIKVSVLGKVQDHHADRRAVVPAVPAGLFGLPIYKLGLVLTGIAAVLTLWSMIQYLRLAWPELRGSAGSERRGRAGAAGSRNAGTVQGFRRMSRRVLLDSRRYGPTIAPLFRAGIAQLVERNLAKVEVASSSLVSRSKTSLVVNDLRGV